MDKVSLKVVVAGRTYPLTVNASEVDRVESAAAEINRAIKQLQDNFAVRDMQDLLAMTALQLSSKKANNSGQNTVASSSQSVIQEPDYSEASNALKHLVQQLNALEIPK